MKSDLRSPVVVSAWVFLSVVMSVAGPFGSYEHIPFLQRAVFWIAVTALAIVVATFIRMIVRDSLGIRGFLASAMLISVISGAAMAFPLVVIARELSQGAGYMPPAFWEAALFVTVLSLGFCSLRHGVENGAGDAVQGAGELADVAPAGESGGAGDRPRLLARLPEELRGPVLRLSARDHYVDVQTTEGSHALLMRLSDAIAELDGVKGEQVHRSHWVAASAVTGATRHNGRWMLRLGTGDEVPVSRSYVDAVQGQGWLDHA